MPLIPIAALISTLAFFTLLAVITISAMIVPFPFIAMPTFVTPRPAAVIGPIVANTSG